MIFSGDFWFLICSCLTGVDVDVAAAADISGKNALKTSADVFVILVDEKVKCSVPFSENSLNSGAERDVMWHSV